MFYRRYFPPLAVWDRRNFSFCVFLLQLRHNLRINHDFGTLRLTLLQVARHLQIILPERGMPLMGRPRHDEHTTTAPDGFLHWVYA